MSLNSKLFKAFSVLVLLILVTVIAYGILTHLYPQNYKQHIEKYASEYNIKPELIYAIVKCESNFKAESVSHAGAIGLMQITPETFKWATQRAGDKNLTENSIYDAVTNIKYGCYIFSLFLDEFESEQTALACYNAGRGSVLKWLDNKKYSDDGIILKEIPFKETREYVKKVINTAKIYKTLY